MMTINRAYVVFILVLAFSHAVLGQPKWYSLIVGVKKIDQIHYGANAVSYPDHTSATNDVDVNKIKRIALDNEHHIVALTNENATRAAILDTLESIGKAVQEGDGFLFYFSGHADAVGDTNEEDRTTYDQALVAYDGLIRDDEIHALITRYFNKTRNVFMVDACYPSATFKKASFFLDFTVFPQRWLRWRHEAIVMQQRIILPRSFHTDEPVPEKHSIIYFGSASDHNATTNRQDTGVMTYWLSRLYRDGRFHGSWRQLSYTKLACELSEKMTEHQHTLQYHEVGQSINQYRNQIPFKL